MMALVAGIGQEAAQDGDLLDQLGEYDAIKIKCQCSKKKKDAANDNEELFIFHNLDIIHYLFLISIFRGDILRKFLRKLFPS